MLQIMKVGQLVVDNDRNNEGAKDTLFHGAQLQLEKQEKLIFTIVFV